MSQYAETPLADLTVEFGERPLMPLLPEATDAHRRQGKQLAAIHRMHLMDLHRIGKVLEHIERGDGDPSALLDAIKHLPLTENMKTFGALCGRECRVLTFHHDAEENMIFPMLEAKQITAMTAVVTRLREEHEVVHELILRLERAAAALVDETSDEAFKHASETFNKLVEIVRSHFGYEETQLEEALGLYVPVF
ncbi:MAG: hemerythrin domain-containing protein [Alphaproteobacteria bacterium]